MKLRSTGPLSVRHLDIDSVDIGVPILSMHSIDVWTLRCFCNEELKIKKNIW